MLIYRYYNFTTKSHFLIDNGKNISTVKHAFNSNHLCRKTILSIKTTFSPLKVVLSSKHVHQKRNLYIKTTCLHVHNNNIIQLDSYIAHVSKPLFLTTLSCLYIKVSLCLFDNSLSDLL